MFNKFINKELKIFVSNIDLFNNINTLQYFNKSTFFVYTNSSYVHGFIPLYQIPSNQTFDIIIIDSTYMYDMLNKKNIDFNYIITDGNHIIQTIKHIDSYLSYYLYTKEDLIKYNNNFINIIDKSTAIVPQIDNQLKNMFIPIFIRTKDRPYYLYTMLKSLTGSIINNTKIHIIDDCSQTQICKKFLYTNQKISENPFSWNNEFNNTNDINTWHKQIGDIPVIKQVYGIKNKFEIIKPNNNQGDLHGLLFTIKTAFEMYPNTENIIILEDDLVFNKDWLTITKYIYSKINKPFGYITLYKHARIS